MSALTESPLLLLAVSFGVLVLATWIGARVGRHRSAQDDNERTVGVVLAATFTLLALITGFAFSMAVARYDLRKSCEAAEANAIGTEYARAGLLPAADAARVRVLLEAYLHERIRFYEVRSSQDLRQVEAKTVRLQGELWSAVETAAGPGTAVAALVAAGMNDVLSSQSNTQAAWWNRIPGKAWDLLMLIAIMGAALLGFSGRTRRMVVVQAVLPVLISMAFFLIADIDSPRAGLMNVDAQNLHALADSYAEAARARVPAPTP